LPAKRLKWLRAPGPRSQLQISSEAFCPPWTGPGLMTVRSGQSPGASFPAARRGAIIVRSQPGRLSRDCLAQQLRQLGVVGGGPQRLVASYGARGTPFLIHTAPNVCNFAQTRLPFGFASPCPRVISMTMTAQEYCANARPRLSWAESTSDPDNREAFFALDATWISELALREYRLGSADIRFDRSRRGRSVD
jgi:hypothetical protein